MNNTNESQSQISRRNSVPVSFQNKEIVKTRSPEKFLEPEFKIIEDDNKNGISAKKITKKFLNQISRILVLMVIILQLIVLYQVFY
jgi:hypothetical protein